MRLFIITLHDSAAEAFHAPLFFPAIGQAERWFRDEIASGGADSQVAKHPEDFTLYLLGGFESSTAEIVTETPRILMRGLDVMQRKPA